MKNFEEQLIEKYPSLFYRNEKEELYCPCGVWVPCGWEKIVDNLCSCINNYITCSYRTGDEPISFFYYPWNIIHKIILFLIKRGLFKNNHKLRSWLYSFSTKICIRKRKYSNNIKIFPPEIKIDQIKEKFGGLRFYYSGGDDQVYGMILFAEYLCSKTCEVSGKDGTLHSANGWYKTISLDLAGKEHYERYKPVDKLV